MIGLLDTNGNFMKCEPMTHMNTTCKITKISNPIKSEECFLNDGGMEFCEGGINCNFNIIIKNKITKDQMSFIEENLNSFTSTQRRDLDFLLKMGA